jgi:hypothetical protein
VSRRWPDSLAATLAFWAMSACLLAWFGSKTWTGYQRRRPLLDGRIVAPVPAPDGDCRCSSSFFSLRSWRCST